MKKLILVSIHRLRYEITFIKHKQKTKNSNYR
jgi:hypothetical protein